MIQDALNTILGHCDGAVERDGVGFNKPDAYLVRAVIAEPESQWSPFKTFAMWHICRKYRHTQLPNYGIDFDSIPRPPVPQRLGLGAAASGENAMLRTALPDAYDPTDDFAGDAEAIAAFRAAWDEIKTERNAAKIKEKEDRERLVSENKGRLEEEREARLAEKNRRCVHWGTEQAGVCTFQYPYDKSLYDLVKDGGAARWDGQNYRWVRPADGGAARVAMILAQENGFELDGTTQQDLCEMLGIWEGDDAKRREAVAQAEEERRASARFANSPHATGDTITFRFPYNPTISEQIKALGGKWDGSEYQWYVTVTARNVVKASAALLALIENAGWFLMPEVAALLKRMVAQGQEERQNMAYMAELSRAEDADLALPPTFKGKARNFQKAGALYALKAKRTFIGDDRGLGKTVESLLAVEIAQAYPALVVCPASAKFNWRKEASKFISGLDAPGAVAVLSGKVGPDVVNAYERLVALDTEVRRYTFEERQNFGLLGEMPPVLGSVPKAALSFQAPLVDEAAEGGKPVEGGKPAELQQERPQLTSGHADSSSGLSLGRLASLKSERDRLQSILGDIAHTNLRLVVINYDILPQWETILSKIGFKAMIADESHYLKNGKTLRGQCVHRLSRGVEYRFLLSGTVIKNRARELVHQLEILDRLEDLGGDKHFKFEYCLPQFDGWGYTFDGVSNGDVLNERLRETCLRYNEQVSTEFGLVAIGDIVEKRLPVRVWSKSEEGCVELRRAVAFSKREHRASMVRIGFSGGSLVCTPDHKVWTQDGYKRADALARGVHLLALRNPQNGQQSWRPDSSTVLRSEVRGGCSTSQPFGDPGRSGDAEGATRSGHYQGLRMVRSRHDWKEHEGFQGTKILRPVLRKQLEADSSTRAGHHHEDARGCGQVEGPSSTKNRRCVAGASQVAGGRGKNARDHEGEDLCPASRGPHIACGQASMSVAGFRRGCAGIQVRSPEAVGEVSGRADLFPLAGHCSCPVEDCDRDRWVQPSIGSPAPDRSVEDRRSYWTRVESVEILEPGGDVGDGARCHGGEFVYDIEVEGNHNFFVSGVLVSNCYIRREKTQVLKELPVKQRNTVWVDLSNREEYEEAEQSLFRFLMEKARKQATEKGELVGLPPEEQSALLIKRVDEGMFKVSQAEKLVQMNALRQVCAKGKMEAIKEWVGDFLETDQKLVMFGWHRSTVLGLSKAFKTPTIMGGDSAQKRFDVVESFQTDPAVRALSCNLVAASEAITLTAAADTVHVELGWNPGTHDQAEDRVLRIGQTAQSVNAWYLLAENTVDEELWNLIEDKRRGTDAVNIGRYTGGELVQMGKKEEDTVDVGMLNALMDRMTQRAIRAQKGVE